MMLEDLYWLFFTIEGHYYREGLGQTIGLAILAIIIVLLLGSVVFVKIYEKVKGKKI